MNRRTLPLIVLAALAAGCGDSSTGGDSVVGEIHGTPFRTAKTEPPPAKPAPAPLGDVDRTPQSDTAPSVVAAVQAPPSPPPAPAPAADAKPEDYKAVSYDDLAGFECASYASEGAKTVVPEKIRGLSGKRVAVDGYMMPLVYEAGGAKKFLLMRNQFGCCSAVSPKINEWIEVTMQGGSVADYIPHVLVTVWGEFEVKEESRGGMSVGLYKMKGTRSEFTEAK